MKSPEEQLDLEFAYTTWDQSCKDPYDMITCCRRARWHDLDFHAAGFGPGRKFWPVIPSRLDV